MDKLSDSFKRIFNSEEEEPEEEQTFISEVALTIYILWTRASGVTLQPHAAIFYCLVGFCGFGTK